MLTQLISIIICKTLRISLAQYRAQHEDISSPEAMLHVKYTQNGYSG